MINIRKVSCEADRANRSFGNRRFVARRRLHLNMCAVCRCPSRPCAVIGQDNRRQQGYNHAHGKQPAYQSFLHKHFSFFDLVTHKATLWGYDAF